MVVLLIMREFKKTRLVDNYTEFGFIHTKFVCLGSTSGEMSS